MQVLTGQGKSVLLGMMSLILAIMGHSVTCVCYSDYLSNRDFKDFKDIFEAY